MTRYFYLILLIIAQVSPAFSTISEKKAVFPIKEGFLSGQKQTSTVLRGRVTDQNGDVLQGASVIITGSIKGVNTNENGEYLLEKLQTGKITVQVSLMGFKTRLTDIELQPGNNELSFTLDEDMIHLNPVTVIAQKREQQILDVPGAISVVDREFVQKVNITGMEQLSDFVPGLLIFEHGANRPTYVIRGMTSEEVSPSAQPRVSVYLNNVPINRANSASIALFDMERVEVSKGPQNTLFGRGAQIGAIQYLTREPGYKTSGYITAGPGNYNAKEVRGALNLPLIKDKLAIRLAGLYDYRDGFVENTFGGTLNGQNTVAGRMSARYKPARNHQFDLILNYQKDDTPGVAFMSRQFPNTVLDTSIFTYRASLEQGNNLRTGKDIFDATLRYRFEISEHTFITSTSSYRKTSSSARWDGDGTAAPAIDMWEDAGATQFYQELRYNFAIRSRLIGSAGASYWHEKADDTYWFSPNEQSMAVLFLNPSYLIMPNGQPLLIPALPDDPNLGPLAGMPLPESHQENNQSAAINRSSEAFADLTYQLLDKLYLNGGIRVAYEQFELNNEAAFTGGSPSTLGMMTGNYPNLFFRPSPSKSMNDNSFSVTWQAGVQYKISDKTNAFARYSNGRRPRILQYTSTGEPEILNAETVDNIEAGLKTVIGERIFLDLAGFYQKYSNFQTRAWIADPGSGEFNYKSIDGGKATSYGLESSFHMSLIKGLEVFGNYAFLHATFDSTDADGSRQEYAGNSFRLSPEHSFTAGISARCGLSSAISLFITPTYAFRSHFYFEDANTPGLEQPSYGLLNIYFGVELAHPALKLGFYCNNILGKQFVTSAGNTGSLFGVPTFTPGPPRMIGTRLTWEF